MIKVGITGQMGSGKSYISSLFGDLGVPIYNSDERARWINNNNISLKNEIISEFGDVYTDGIMDKYKMRNIVFVDGGEEKLKRINSIVIPYVFRDFLEFCDINSNNPMILGESAILFESKMDKYVDKVIYVDVPYEIRLERTIRRDNITKSEYDNRMKSQIGTEEKIKLSDYVIDNSIIDSKVDIVKNIYNNLVN